LTDFAKIGIGFTYKRGHFEFYLANTKSLESCPMAIVPYFFAHQHSNSDSADNFITLNEIPEMDSEPSLKFTS